MHIVFVTNELEAVGSASGGLAKFTANMINIFYNHGHRVTVILVSDRKIHQRFLLPVHVEQIAADETQRGKLEHIATSLFPNNEDKRKNAFTYFSVLAQNMLLRKQIDLINRNEKVDIVHYCNHGALALFADARIPCVVRISSFYNMARGAWNRQTFTDDYYDYPLNISEKLVDFMLRRTRAIISPSINTARVAQKVYGRKVKVLESPFVLNEQGWNDALYNQYLKGRRYILHAAGRLGYLKGTHILAQITYSILEENPDIYIVLAGKSERLYDEQEEKYVLSHELISKRAGKYGERIIYLGYLTSNSLYPIVKNAEISFQPSRFDNLPNACIEAMAMRTLVIGTNKASYEQLIEDGRSGFLGERDQPETYLPALKKALSLKKEEREELLDRAEKRILMLQPDRVYHRYLKYYNYVINSWKKRKGVIFK